MYTGDYRYRTIKPQIWTLKTTAGRLQIRARRGDWLRGADGVWKLSSILTNARPHLVLVVPATVERTKDSWQSEEYFTKLRSLVLEVFYHSSSAQAYSSRSILRLGHHECSGTHDPTYRS